MPRYEGKVKCVSIDPPYNTGKDFIDKDKFTIGKTAYEEETKAKDEEGGRLAANTDTSGRYHSHWLSMMYPRLKLAGNLLSQNGAIFISIDNHEQHNLRKIMNEIFGAYNFIAQFIRKIGHSMRKDAEFVSVQQEYVMMYARERDHLQVNFEPVKNLDTYKFSDKHEAQRGKYRLYNLDMSGIRGDENRRHPITTPDRSKVTPRPNYFWRWGKAKVEWGIENDYIVFKKRRDGEWGVYFKLYQFVDNNLQPIQRSLPYQTISVKWVYNRSCHKSYARNV